MKFRKNIQIKILIVCAVLVMMAQGALQTVSAEKGGNASGYTYTITLYAGKEGTFAGGGSEQKITGLAYGDVVSLQSYLSAVKVKDADKYYVRGIRESGKDNNTVSNPAFKVDCDREYVVAYGIRGNMTKYTVNYETKKGKKLLPSETFYGVVGDQAVVAFQYVDGYRPQAYNLAKTLSSDEAENVFTFTYKKTDQNAQKDEDKKKHTDNTTDTGAADESSVVDTDGSSIVSDLVDITDDTDNADAGKNTASAAGRDNGDQAGNAQSQDDAAADTNAGDDTGEPEDLINLNGGRTPLENLKLLQEKLGGFFYILVALIVLAVLLIILLLLRKKKEKDKREQEERKQEEKRE